VKGIPIDTAINLLFVNPEDGSRKFLRSVRNISQAEKYHAVEERNFCISLSFFLVLFTDISFFSLSPSCC
jgi:hypothetical protein